MKPFIIPTDFEMPPGGLNLRWPDDRIEQDRRLQDYKGLCRDRVCPRQQDQPCDAGFAERAVRHHRLRQKLRGCAAGAARTRCRRPRSPRGSGSGSTKSACRGRWSRRACAQFAVGLEEILIIEERREIVENQVKQELFNWRDDVRPRIVGKMDEHDKRFLPFEAEISVSHRW